MVKVEKDPEPEQEEVLPRDRAYQAPKITELFLVSAAAVNFFKSQGLKKGDGLTAAEIREIVKKYATENGLISSELRGKVKLDPVLAGLVLGKGENDVTVLAWEDVNQRIQSKVKLSICLSVLD